MDVIVFACSGWVIVIVHKDIPFGRVVRNRATSIIDGTVSAVQMKIGVFIVTAIIVGVVRVWAMCGVIVVVVVVIVSHDEEFLSLFYVVVVKSAAERGPGWRARTGVCAATAPFLPVHAVVNPSGPGRSCWSCVDRGRKQGLETPGALRTGCYHQLREDQTHEGPLTAQNLTYTCFPLWSCPKRNNMSSRRPVWRRRTRSSWEKSKYASKWTHVGQHVLYARCWIKKPKKQNEKCNAVGEN